MKSKYAKLSIALAALITIGGCGLKKMAKMAAEQEINVNPSPLELHGDSVSFEISTTLPDKMLKKNKLYTLKTFYKYGDPSQEQQKYDFKDLEFEYTEGTISKSQKFTFFYEEGMDMGDVYVQGVASNVEKTKYQETPEKQIATGIITTSRLGQNAYASQYAPHGYNNQEELIPVNVIFHFEQGSAVLRSSEVRGESGTELDAFIAAKFNTKTVTITGTHSPEGTESTNERLSEDRATVIKNFYFKKMKQYDYKDMADSIKFETKTVFQDWNILKTALNEYDGLSTDEKNQILSIVNAGGKSYADTQKEIEALSFYKALLKDFYPKLRTSTTEILRVKEKKTDAEISVLAKGIAEGSFPVDTLTYQELMYAATLTPLLEEKSDIYLAASKDSATWEAHNNLGVTFIQMSEKVADASAKAEYIAKAKTQLELSTGIEQTAENLNNLGVCYLLSDDKAQALTTYSSAEGAKAGGESIVFKFIKAGKGTAEIRYAEYQNAIANSGEAVDTIPAAQYNLALAQLLTKDYDKAKQNFTLATQNNPKDALAFYCLAIVNARTSNPVELGAALKSAVDLDPSLKAKAVSDLEFANFKEDSNFMDALK